MHPTHIHLPPFSLKDQGPSILFINKLDLYNGLVAGSVRWMVNNQVSGAYGTLLPVDVDGPVEPPAGSLVPFFSLGSQLYRFNYQLNYDARTATLVSTQAVAGNYAFQQLCPSATGCVPQLGTNRLLDTLGDRLMNRVAYRNFGTYDVVLISHTINVLSSGTQGGVRWYEVRNIAYGSPVNVLRQFGNYAPDTNWRWMSSIAMDKVGNIAIGYSKSSGGMFPAIAASGRLATDPLNTMTQVRISALPVCSFLPRFFPAPSCLSLPFLSPYHIPSFLGFFLLLHALLSSFPFPLIHIP